MSEPEPTPGPWGFEAMPCENTYGDGDDVQEGYNAYAIVDAQGRVLFDSLNRDDRTSLIEEEHDEDGRLAWDGQARVDARLGSAAPDMLSALRDCIDVMENDLKGLSCIQPELRVAKAAYAKATGETP